jgi:hypothetical protein
MGRPFHLINFPQRALFGVVLLCSSWASSLFGDKVTQSVIVASIEGEVSSLNLIDDFKVSMSSSYVGKKISPKTILTTGKTGKVSLLFSNGTLITIKPGSRFYLRKYKQLEAVVEDLVPPGKLEEEPTKSELSAHLDFGDLIVKAPRLKKGSSMNLSSPIGTAGIRGTMFQFMAVRNPVTGDIMGGINLVSGDIDFTDTDGNLVTILSGQSIQLATSKLGESVASQTGELVDLSSTYGPALTEDGALPPPISSIFPNLNLDGESDDESASEDDGSFDEPIVVGPSAGDLDFIHEIASEVFFAIGESEQVSSDFTFESIQMAPPVEAPIPEVEAPSAPAAVTGETVAGGNIDRFLGLPPELKLRGGSGPPHQDPLLEMYSNGARIVAEFRDPSEGLTWADLDPGVDALDFLDNDIESSVVLSNVPNVVLTSPFSAPGIEESIFYNVVYEVTDFRNSSTSITRQVEVRATRPAISSWVTLPEVVPFTDPEGIFQTWIDSILVRDKNGTKLEYSSVPKNGSFYFVSATPDLDTEAIYSFRIRAQDWRGLTSDSDEFTISVEAKLPVITSSPDDIIVELSDQPLSVELNKPEIHKIKGVAEFPSDDPSDDLTIKLSEVVLGNETISIDTPIHALEDKNYSLTFMVSDSRGVQTKVNRNLRIQVTRPVMQKVEAFQSSFSSALYDSSDSKLSSSQFEYKVKHDELESWLNSQTGLDQVGDKKTLTATPSIYSYSENKDGNNFPPLEPENLPPGTYEISFSAYDSRYDALPPETKVDWANKLKTKRTIKSLEVIATPPKFVEVNPTQTASFEVDNRPWEDFDPWFKTITVKDVERNKLTRSEEVGAPSDGEVSLLAEPNLFIEGNQTITYKATDSRGINSSISRDVQVIRTQPTIKFDYHEMREGLSSPAKAEDGLWHTNYLVKPRYNSYLLNADNGDDGSFEILSSSNKQSKKLYYTITAYNGEEVVEIESPVVGSVKIEGEVDYSLNNFTDEINSTYEITVTFDDSIYRNTDESNGSVESIPVQETVKVQIVDILPPIMTLSGDGKESSGPYEIEGIAERNVAGSYIFPDPGYDILDNYYSETEIEEALGIDSDPNPIEFSYPSAPDAPSLTVSFGSNQDYNYKSIPDGLIIGKVELNPDSIEDSPFEINYQNIKDKSGVQALDSLVRYVRVIDKRSPDVKLYGAPTISENLAEILLEEQFYSDRGAFANEDLSKSSNGKVDWQQSGWEWSRSLKNWDFENETWVDVIEFNNQEIVLSDLDKYSDPVEAVIEIFKENPSVVPTELKLELTYILTDKADNNGSAVRIINFTNTSNLVPTLSIADPSITIGEPHVVEVGSIDSAPAVDASLGYSQYSTPVTPRNNEYYLVATDDTNETVSSPDWNKVNFHRSESGVEYYVDPNGVLHASGTTGWRKFIVRYSAVNPDFPENVGILDLEIRIQDTSPPSFTIPDSTVIEAGVSFTDDGISDLTDNYFDADDLTTQVTITKTAGGIAQVFQSPIGTEDVFDDLENEGFWEIGNYTITHTAKDDFNNSRTKSYDITVEDTIAPHIALVTEDFLKNPSEAILKAQYDTETLYLDVPNKAGVPAFSKNSYSVDKWSNDLWTAMSSPAGWVGGKFDKTSPYVVYQQNKTFYLKQSEIANIDSVVGGGSGVTEVYQDDFGRSFIWYSAFVLNNNGDDFLRDPGVLIVNPSNYDVTIRSDIQPTYQGETSQLTSLKFSYEAIQNNVQSSEISIDSNYSKTIYFLDEVKPLITLSPEDDIGLTGPNNSQYFLIEAGVDYLTDTRSFGFNLWEGDTSTSVPDALSDSTHTLSVSAIDIVDGDLTEEIQRSFFFFDAEGNSSVVWSSSTLSGDDNLNKTYFV